jgi:hypothetical protein
MNNNKKTKKQFSFAYTWFFFERYLNVSPSFIYFEGEIIYQSTETAFLKVITDPYISWDSFLVSCFVEPYPTV